MLPISCSSFSSSLFPVILRRFSLSAPLIYQSVTSLNGTLHFVVILRHYISSALLFHFHLLAPCPSLLVYFLPWFFLSSIPHTCVPFVSRPALRSLPQSGTGQRILSHTIVFVLYSFIFYIFQFLSFSFSHFAHIDDFPYLPPLHLLVIFSPGRSYFKVAMMSTFLPFATNLLAVTTLLRSYSRPNILYEHLISDSGYLLGLLTIEDGTDKLSRNVGKELTLLAT